MFDVLNVAYIYNHSITTVAKHKPLNAPLVRKHNKRITVSSEVSLEEAQTT